MVKKFLYLIVAIAMVLSSCGHNNTKSTGEFGSSSDSTVSDSALPIDKSAMEDLVQNIGSPVEMAALIKSLGVPFSQKLLAPTNIDNFNTNYSKAFHLGILAADLGYLNMFGKTSSVLSYITSMKNLADGINVGQFFDFTTLKRLATNNENVDSLIYISMHSFNVMDDYLRKNKRSNLSALMISGVYLEGLYLTTQVVKLKPSQKLTDYIGEQKIIFEQLLLILKNYEKDPYFASLLSDLSSIKKEYASVSITYTKGEPKSVEKNGMLTIEYSSTSIVDMKDDVLKRIVDQTESVRNKLIK